jgi:His-Xaa-Ser system protein HxsD
MSIYIQAENSIQNNKIIYFADSHLYSQESIFKCTYWYTDKFTISINLESNKYYKIVLTPKIDLLESELIGILNKLGNDLIDFRLRDMITKETQNIRELLIAKAFSNYPSEEEPPGNIK